MPPDAPVVVMVHGWRYAPGIARDCPHGSILSLDPPPQDRRAVSWPRHLGLDGKAGLGIAHSMGTRVALAALPLVAPGQITRLILLAAAETRSRALAALSSPAGDRVEVINVTTRENDLFDAFFEWGVHLGLRTSIGQGLGRARGNWHDLWIDQPASLHSLARLGHPLPDAPRRICHWSPYLRPGTIALYRALIDGRLLAADLPRQAPGRRWSRLILGARDTIPGPGLPAV